MSNYIIPWNYITKDTIVPDKVMNVQEWFQTENMVIELGEWVGRPGPRYALNQAAIGWFLGQGWVIKAVTDRESDGNWQAITNTTNTNTNKYDNKVNNDGGLSSGNATTTNTVRSNSSTPYYYTYSTYWLERRKLLGENVLQDMITQFTNAYNEGRQLNNQRYIDLLRLYSAISERTQQDLVGISDTFEEYQPLIEQIIAQMKLDVEEFKEQTDGIYDDFGKGTLAAINLRFDNEIAEARSSLITKGMYNSTIWESTKSGINRNRELALLEAKDRTAQTQVKLASDVIGLRRDMAKMLYDTYSSIWEARNKYLITPLEMRNQTLKWMADFVERKEDEYPDLAQITNITNGLGYANAGFAAS